MATAKRCISLALSFGCVPACAAIYWAIRGWLTMIKWENGEPDEIKPGMLVQYEHGGTELVGSSLRTIECSDIRRYCQVVPTYWLEWADSMANHIGHQK